MYVYLFIKRKRFKPLPRDCDREVCYMIHSFFTHTVEKLGTKKKNSCFTRPRLCARQFNKLSYVLVSIKIFYRAHIHVYIFHHEKLQKLCLRKRVETSFLYFSISFVVIDKMKKSSALCQKL